MDNSKKKKTPPKKTTKNTTPKKKSVTTTTTTPNKKRVSKTQDNTTTTTKTTKRKLEGDIYENNNEKKKRDNSKTTNASNENGFINKGNYYNLDCDQCHKPLLFLKVRKEGPNKGREFCKCPCGKFCWNDSIHYNNDDFNDGKCFRCGYYGCEVTDCDKTFDFRGNLIPNDEFDDLY